MSKVIVKYTTEHVVEIEDGMSLDDVKSHLQEVSPYSNAKRIVVTASQTPKAPVASLSQENGERFISYPKVSK